MTKHKWLARPQVLLRWQERNLQVRKSRPQFCPPRKKEERGYCVSEEIIVFPLCFSLCLDRVFVVFRLSLTVFFAEATWLHRDGAMLRKSKQESVFRCGAECRKLIFR